MCVCVCVFVFLFFTALFSGWLGLWVKGWTPQAGLGRELCLLALLQGDLHRQLLLSGEACCWGLSGTSGTPHRGAPNLLACMHAYMPLCLLSCVYDQCTYMYLLLSRNYRGSFAKFYWGFPETGYLDDMCCVKLSRNHNFPFANIIAEFSPTPKFTCNVRFYINPLQGPLDCCSCM